ncbi:hypothetical protein MXB_1559, partial [Myxobolus squamalis]
FLKVISFIIYESSKKLKLHNELYQTITIYHSFVLSKNILASVQTALPLHVLLLSLCDFTNIISIKKSEIKMFELMMDFLHSTQLEENANQFTVLISSQILHGPNQTLALKKSIQFCSYFLKNSPGSKVSEFLGYFLHSVHSNFANKLLGDSKSIILNVVIDSFISCHIIKKNPSVINYTKNLMQSLLKLIKTTKLNNKIKAKCYYLSVIISYVTVIPQKIESTENKNWIDCVASSLHFKRSIDHVFLAVNFFIEYFQKDVSKAISPSISTIVINLAYILLILDEISTLSSLIYSFMNAAISTHTNSFVFTDILKVLLLFKQTAHGISFNNYIPFLAKMKQNNLWYFALFEAFNANESEIIVDRLVFLFLEIEKNSSSSSRMQQLWLILLIKHVFEHNFKVSEFFKEIRFPIFTATQCYLLSVKIIDHIFIISDDVALTTGSLELVFLNFYCLKNSCDYLISSGCLREANSLLYILWQHSITLQSKPYLLHCVKLLGKNLKNECFDKFESFKTNIMTLREEEEESQTNNLQTKICFWDFELCFESQKLPEGMLEPFLNYGNLDFEHKSCRLPITFDIYDSKLNILQKIKNINVEKFSSYFPCCDLLTFNLKSKINEILSNSDSIELFERLQFLEISGKNRSQQNNSPILNEKFYMNNLVATRHKLRRNTKFSSITSLMSSCCIPELDTKDIQKIIYGTLYPMIPDDWTVIHINYFNSQQFDTNNHDYLFVTINHGKNPIIIKKEIKYEPCFDFQISLSEIIAENDNSSKSKGQDFWKVRYDLEKNLKEFILTLDSIWLKPFDIFLNGEILDKTLLKSLQVFFKKFKAKFKKNIDYHVFEALVCNCNSYDCDTLLSAAAMIEPKLTKTNIN